MRIFLAASTAMLVLAAPAAHAQILGGIGGGLGGSIGGTLGGTFGGAGSIDPMGSIDSATSGTLRGAGSAAANKSVDRKSGQVHADGNADGSLAGNVAQTVAAPTHMISTKGATSGTGSASGSADAQLIGTDAVRSTAADVAVTARGAAGTGVTTAASLANGAASTAGSASGTVVGSASGAGNAAGASGAGSLALAGSLASSANGAFAVTKGMPVLAPDGEKIGKVREVITDGRGEVRSLLVKVDGEKAVLPAANFTGSGNAVVSAMGEGQIKQVAQKQDETGGQ